MSTKYRIILLIVIIVIIWRWFQYFDVFSEKSETNTAILNHKIDSNVSKIKVTVYYEALCSDSRNFVLKQLLPTYSILHEYMELDLIPYGKAQVITYI